MSKIPQGEWNAIAARHARGETIARIAHDYGCTAPAIHYILKRQKERSGPAVAGAGEGTGAPTMTASATAPLNLRPRAEMRAESELQSAAELRPVSEVRPASEARPAPELRPASEVRSAAELRPGPEVRSATGLRPASEVRSAAEVRPASEVRSAAEPRPPRPEESRRGDTPVFTIGPAASERRLSDPRSERASDHRPQPQPSAARGSALTAGLDTELQSQMEDAIAAFRFNLNAALTDRSPARREELRAAASDLMRMAARTMIVLDRLSAGHDRNPGHSPDYPRSAHAR
jgi:transposase-like protein